LKSESGLQVTPSGRAAALAKLPVTVPGRVRRRVVTEPVMCFGAGGLDYGKNGY
jgi:hypothetical protein